MSDGVKREVVQQLYAGAGPDSSGPDREARAERTDGARDLAGRGQEDGQNARNGPASGKAQRTLAQAQQELDSAGQGDGRAKDTGRALAGRARACAVRQIQSMVGQVGIVVMIVGSP